MDETDAAAPDEDPRAEAPGADQPQAGLRYSDADFLRLVGNERRRPVEFNAR